MLEMGCVDQLTVVASGKVVDEAYAGKPNMLACLNQESVPIG